MGISAKIPLHLHESLSSSLAHIRTCFAHIIFPICANDTFQLADRLFKHLDVCLMQVKADVYEKIDKELLSYVEDVLLNRCENATERMLEFAALLDPKSKPLAVKKLADSSGPVLNLPAKTNPTPPGVYNAEVTELPPVPEYKSYRSDSDISWLV